MPERKFSPEFDARLKSLRNDERLCWEDVTGRMKAEGFAVNGSETCRCRYFHLARTQQWPPEEIVRHVLQKKPTTQVDRVFPMLCMCCGGKFMSWSKVRNRMCPKCRHESDMGDYRAFGLRSVR